MLIKIEGKEMEFDPVVTELSEVFQIIRWELEKKNKMISSLIVDGEEIFNNHEPFVEQRYGLIKTIEVIGATKEQIAMENVALITTHLKAMIEPLAEIAEDFRGGVTEDGWYGFESYMKSLIFIEGVMGDVFGMLMAAERKIRTKAWGKVMSEYHGLDEIFKDLEEFLDHDQTKAAGDAIDERIIPLLKNVLHFIDEM